MTLTGASDTDAIVHLTTENVFFSLRKVYVKYTSKIFAMTMTKYISQSLSLCQPGINAMVGSTVSPSYAVYAAARRAAQIKWMKDIITSKQHYWNTNFSLVVKKKKAAGMERTEQASKKKKGGSAFVRL